MVKIIKNNSGNFLIICLIFSLVAGWWFSGWPQIKFGREQFSAKLAIPPEIQEAQAADTRVIITSATAPSGSCGASCWTTPANWNYASNTIQVIGGGAGGKNGGNNGSGAGGGGAYSSANNIPLTPNVNVTFAVGAGGAENLSGGDTYICNAVDAVNCIAITGSLVFVGAKGGAAPTGSGVNGGLGGDLNAGVASGTSPVKYSGGDGGAGDGTGDVGGGGGGAAGSGGGGGAGESTDGTTGIDGGGGGGGGGDGAGNAAEAGGIDSDGFGGDGPSGTGGGAVANAAGTANTGGGGAGDENGAGNGGAGGTGDGSVTTGSGWGTGIGAGGGGGGVLGNAVVGGQGGNYGGGGGGGKNGGGAGAGGVIVITYTPAVAPGAPTGLATTTVTASQVDLTWTAPASDGGSLVLYYNIYRDGASPATTFLASTTATTYSDTSVSGGTTYFYRTAAVNAVGTGSYSNEISVTTPSAQSLTCTTPLAETTFTTLTNTYVATSSPDATTTVTCTGCTNGFTIRVSDVGSGANPGLWNSGDGVLIGSADDSFIATTTLQLGVKGYGIQATSTAESGINIDPKFRWATSTTDVGGLTLSSASSTLASSTTDVTSQIITVSFKAAVSVPTKGGSYSDAIWYECFIN